MEKANKLVDTLSSWIDTTFQLDRLETLCVGSIFLRAAYAQLIVHINYAMLHEPQIDDPNVVIKIADISYPLTLEGRKGAIAESFRHFGTKVDTFLNAANVSTILGSIDFAVDIAKAVLASSNVHAV